MQMLVPAGHGDGGWPCPDGTVTLQGLKKRGALLASRLAWMAGICERLNWIFQTGTLSTHVSDTWVLTGQAAGVVQVKL